MKRIAPWLHEIVIGLLALWYAIGTSGQSGIWNLVRNTVSHHAGIAAFLATASVVIARLRPVPGGIN